MVHQGNSLVVQWLGLYASTAEGMGSIPGWGTKIPHAAGPKGKKQTNKPWYIQTMECYSKEMSYQAMKRYGGNFNAYHYVNEANLKRLHTISFQLYDILGKTKLWRQ